MEDEALNAKLKHLGGSIDAVRDDVREVKTDLKEFKTKSEDFQNRTDADISALRVEGAERGANIKLLFDKEKDTRLLVWKILALVLALHAGAEKVLSHFF